jgi:hypothetical protein
LDTERRSLFSLFNEFNALFFLDRQRGILYDCCINTT